MWGGDEGGVKEWNRASRFLKVAKLLLVARHSQALSVLDVGAG